MFEALDTVLRSVDGPIPGYQSVLASKWLRVWCPHRRD